VKGRLLTQSALSLFSRPTVSLRAKIIALFTVILVLSMGIAAALGAGAASRAVESAVRDRAVHFCGVSDIIEPYQRWREYKKELTGREWEILQQLMLATPNVVDKQKMVESLSEWDNELTTNGQPYSTNPAPAHTRDRVFICFDIHQRVALRESLM